jgi:hypothetical protein
MENLRSFVVGPAPRAYFWVGYAVGALGLLYLLAPGILVGERNPGVCLMGALGVGLAVGSLFGHVGEEALNYLGRVLRWFT